MSCILHHPEGNPVASHVDLRWIRTHTHDLPLYHVIEVHLFRKDNGEGLLKIVFSDMRFYTVDFLSFVILKDCVRRWRNLYGCLLYIDKSFFGEVEFCNEALAS